MQQKHYLTKFKRKGKYSSIALCISFRFSSTQVVLKIEIDLHANVLELNVINIMSFLCFYPHTLLKVVTIILLYFYKKSGQVLLFCNQK